MQDTQESSSPGLPRRLIAMVYDTFLVLPLVMLTVAIGLGLITLVAGDQAGDLNPNVVRLMILFCLVGFFSFFWLKNGQTLGMQAWRIQLVRSDGSPLALRHCVIRCLTASFSASLLGLGYLWCLVDKNNRYWHDYLSGTELRLLPKPDKKEKKAG